MKLFNKITLLSIGAAMAIGGGVAALSATQHAVSAADASFTLSSASAVTEGGVTATFGKGEGSSVPAWYSAGLRLYAKNTVTLSSESDITGVSFNWEKQGSKAFASVTADVGTYEHPSAAGAGTWTGSAKEVVFTLGASGQLQLNTFTVTTGGASVHVPLDYISCPDMTLEVGETKQATVTYDPTDASNKVVSYEIINNANVASVSDKGVVTALEAGNATLRITPDDDDCDSIDVNILVKAASPSATIDTTKTTQITTLSEALLEYTATDSVQKVSIKKNTASSAANNYYGGDSSNHTSTRVYNGTILELNAGAGYSLKSAKIKCTTNGYANVIKNGTWTGATAVLSPTDDTTVDVTPTDDDQVVSVLLAATAGFTSVEIKYAESTKPVVSIEGAPTTGVTIGNSGTLTFTTVNATSPSVTWSSSDETIVSIDASTGAWTAHKIGVATITASMTCSEGSTTGTATINVNSLGHVSITEALTISSEIGSGKTTDYTVEVTGYITNLDDDNKGAGNERALRIDDVKGGSDVNIMVFGIYSSNELRTYAIIGGKVTVRGNIQNYSGKAEITSPVVVAYEDAAIDFAKTAFASLNEACVSGPAAITSSQWSDLATAFNALTTEEKAKLSAATSENANEDLAKWAARYARCVNYGLSDFMGTGAASNALRTFSNGIVAMIVAISAMSLLAAAIIIRKKQLSK